MQYFTDNPVRDIERHMAEAEGRKHIFCDRCGGSIFAGDDDHYGDEYFELEGQNICSACIDDYVKERKKEYVLTGND